MIIYDNRFNGNEWFVIGLLVVGLTVILALPRRFPLPLSVVVFVFGIFAGLTVDHSISVKPIDYYDVNDNSSYQIMDFLTYVMYGPFSYLFAYLLDRWKIKSGQVPLYILGWALLSVCMEWLSVKVGVFHYKNGYNICYSFPIYLIMISLYVLFLNGAAGVLRRCAA